MKTIGKFYKIDNEHKDETIVLCTDGTINGNSFSGVCVKKGNNSFVGQFSDSWTECVFNKEIENPFKL